MTTNETGYVGCKVMVSPNKLRCLWWTDAGQRVEQWLPGGVYAMTQRHTEYPRGEYEHGIGGWMLVGVPDRKGVEYWVADAALETIRRS